MKNLSLIQQKLLECALEKLYAFLYTKYDVDYKGNIICMVYEDIVHLNQCSCPDRITWFADIVLKDRKIYISIREVERDKIYSINSERIYELFYMGSNPTLHTINF